MDRRFCQTLAVAFTLISIPLTTSPASAAPKDTAALKLSDDAINTDYLATNFAEAEKKLRKAIALCGASACSAQVRGQVHRNLGVVLIAGLNRSDDGRAEFAEAIKADPNVALEKDLTTPDIEAAFRAAKGGGGATSGGGSKGATAGGDMNHTPPAEQATLTPVPIYAELPDGVTAVKVVARYKPFGATEWKSLELRRMSNGYGGEVPCIDIGSTTGDLSYYIQATDASGDIVASHGSRTAPDKVTIKNELAGDPPHLPGRPPSAQCKDASDCPPGLPGCAAGKKSGSKGWGATCEKDSECAAGLACKSGTCDTGEKSLTETAAVAKSCDTSSDCDSGQTCNSDKVCESTGGAGGKKIWLSFNIEQDLSIMSAENNICGTKTDNIPNDAICLAADGGPYVGWPQQGGPGSGNAIKGGPHLSTTRFLVGADLLVSTHFSLGARLGYAINEAVSGISALHAEARVAYWLGSAPFAQSGIRPYLAVMGGLAEMDNKFSIGVNETHPADPNNGIITPSQTLTVWRKSGGAFAGGGAGLMIPTGAAGGVLAELKVEWLFGNSGLAISPTVGYALGF